MKGFNSMMQAICTTWCIVALLLSFLATILSHMAFGVLITPLVELPSNLRTGINDVLHFSTLESDANAVKTHSQTALSKCTITPSLCSNLPARPGSSDTTVELNAIGTIFDNSLATIEKVANDKYLGIGDFAVVAKDLKAMQANLTTLRNTSQPVPCSVTNDLYCQIYKAGDEIVSSMSQVRSGIDSITNSEPVKKYEEQAERASGGFNGLPYIMWVSVLFYGCFWFSNRPSCKGSMGVCLACCCHALFFVLAIVVSLVIVAAGIIVTKVIAEMRLDSPFTGNPTVAELIDHIRVNFPGLYDILLRDLLDGMKKTFNAYVIFLIAQIMLLIHTSTCCCGVYAKVTE